MDPETVSDGLMAAAVWNQRLSLLTYREREIIKLRYGIGDGYIYTLEECGRIFKVTRERIRHVEQKALMKLQRMSRHASEQCKGAAFLTIAGGPFSVRVRRCCECTGIVTYADLAKKNPEDLLSIRNFGQKCLDECVAALEAVGLHLAMREDTQNGHSPDLHRDPDAGPAGR